MLDLHCHILPGVDDGAPDTEVSVDMASTAVADGINMMVATPHINFDFELDPHEIGRRVGELNLALVERDIPLGVLPGAEIAISRLGALDQEVLRMLRLGGGPYLLVESPYAGSTPYLEDLLFDLDIQGFGTILAHPERCPMFERDRERLARLVERGVLCSVTAGSMAGQFGRRVKAFAVHMFRAGLVHDVASDAHDDHRRRAELTWAFDELESDLPGISEQAEWFTDVAPRAIVSGAELPEVPEPPVPRRRWERLRRSARG
jgi:protein-tyrosine phosphatase